MAKSRKHENDLINALIKIQRGDNASDKESTLNIRECVLAVGSATPDNLNCVKHIEVGSVRRRYDPPQVRGVKVRGRPIMVSEIINTLEDAPIPTLIREEYPKLTDAEWRACLRIVTLILSSLEHERWEP